MVTNGAKPDVQSLHSKLTGRMGRRRFLRTAAKAGVSGELIRSLDESDFLAVDDDEVPIVYGYVTDRSTEPWSVRRRVRAVPAEWYDQLEFAFSVQKEIFKRDISGIVGSFVVPGDFSDPKSLIRLDVASDTVKSRITSLFSDISFDVNTIEDLSTSNEGEDYGEPLYVDDLDERHVPGGVRCSTSEIEGSLAPALYDVDDQQAFFTTSNHLYTGANYGHEGQSLFLEGEDDRRRIGVVERGYSSEDFVLVHPENGYRPSSKIQGATPSRVIGQFTKYGLADLQARGERLEKIGATSGHSSGKIHGVDGVTCYYGDICKRGQLKWGSQDDMADGDSGSVAYAPDPENPDEYALVAGFNNARTWWPGADFTWGTAAHHLSSNYGYYF